MQILSRVMEVSFWLAAVVLAVLGYFAWLQVQSAEATRKRSAEYEARHNILMSDPFVKRILDENEQKCSDQEVYVWAGGVTLRFKRPSGYTKCSRPGSPWFAGTLVLPRTPKEVRTWAWPQLTPFFLHQDPACSVKSCPILTILGGPEEADFIPALRLRPPTSLSEEPNWPDFENVSTYGTWQEGAWAKFQGAVIRFTFGQGLLRDLKGYQPPVSIVAQHPRYPVLISVELPAGQREHWRENMRAAFALIDENVVSLGEKSDSVKPPPNVRFLAEEFNGALEFLQQWRAEEARSQAH